jgi:hypothetical protein
MSSKPRTLVLFARYAEQLSYFDDWLQAFVEAPQLAVETLNICERGATERLRRTRDEYDLLVLLHSTNGDWLTFLRELVPLLAERRGLLLSFVGNEVNIPGMPLAEKIRVLEAIRPDWVATQLLLEAGEYLYRHVVRRQVVAIPHALNPSAFHPVTDGERPIDVGVRTAWYAAYLGDDERNRLIRVFQTRELTPPLKVDISTTERFDRDGWAAFLNRCKGTIATQAGSWYLQPDDRTVNAIRAWVLAREKKHGFVLTTDSPLQKLAMLTPQRVRRVIRKVLRRGPLKVEVSLYEKLEFAEVWERFFRDTPRAPVYSKCISSRHFDAIGTKTCQIMIKGRFNDILRAGEHYLALEDDLSNLDDVLARFRDPDARSAVVEAAYAHVMAGHTYAHRMREIAALIGA